MKIFFKLLGFITAALFCLIFLFIAFLPAFLSTGYGKTFLINRLNSSLNGNITIERLHLSWLGNQDVEKIQFIAPNGEAIFSADRLSGDFSLFTFLFGNSLRTLALDNVNAVIATDSRGNTNFEKSFNELEKHDPIFFKNVDIAFTNNGNEFFLKGKGLTMQNGLQGSFVIDAELADVKRVQLNAINFPVMFLDQLVTIYNTKLKGLALNLIGSKFDEVSITTLDNNISLEATSSSLKAHLKGQIKKDSILLGSDSKIALSLPKENIRELLANRSIAFLGEPRNTFNLEIHPKDLSIPIFKQNINQLEGELSIQADAFDFGAISLTKATANAIFPLDDEKFFLNIESSGKSPHSPFQSSLAFALGKDIFIPSKTFGGPISVNGTVEAHNIAFIIEGKKENGKIQASIDPQKDNLPHLVLHLSQKGKDFFPLSGTLDLKGIPQEIFNIYQITLPFQADLENVNFDFQAYTKERKNLMEGSGILTTWRDFDHLEGEAYIDLFETDFLNSGHFFKGTVQTNLFSNGQIAANVQLAGSKQSHIKKIEGAIIGNRNSPEIAFNFNADNSSLKGSLIHRNWDLHPLTIGMQGQLKEFPITFLCPLIDAKICKKAIAIFGPLVHGNAEMQINNGNGQVSLLLQGGNGSFQLDGQVKENILYLNEPLKAKLHITSEFKKEILDDLLPFLTPIKEANEPIEAEISVENFKLPFKKFSINELSIGKGTLQLPAIIVGSQSQLSKSVSLIGLNQDVEVVFTPLYFSMENGILDLKRMDMLLNKQFPIASWGSVDFAKNKLKLTVGITGSAIAKAFDLSAKNGMLQIPIKGAINKPQIDTRRAAARISALIAQQRGGAEGRILGTVLEAASGIGEGKIPPPTTDPLPWD